MRGQQFGHAIERVAFAHAVEIDRHAGPTKRDRLSRGVELDVLHADALAGGFNLFVAGNAPLAPREAPRLGERAAGDVERAVCFADATALPAAGGRIAAARPRPVRWPARRLMSNHFAVVAIDGHLRFERFDQVERREHVLHRIVVAGGRELHFEFAGHRPAANAHDERTARGQPDRFVGPMNAGQRARARRPRLAKNCDVCGARRSCDVHCTPRRLHVP